MANHNSEHYILSTSTALKVFAALIVMTVLTVAVAMVDLGPLNLLVALVVATIKAHLVSLVFMNLRKDVKSNALIFYTSFVFLAIFMGLTGFDWYYRGDVYVKGDIMAATAGNGAAAPSRFKKAWQSTPELVAYGKELYGQQCVACHGADGMGSGPAAGALNPPPRNFHKNEGWKNGRKPSMVFKTLKEGLAGSSMASYGSLPADQRWALAHYLISLGPKPLPTDSAADLAKIGIDPSKEAVEEKVSPTIPVKLAIARMSEGDARYASAVFKRTASAQDHPGSPIYRAQCLGCHGPTGAGGFKIRNLGNQSALVASAWTADHEAIRSAERFNEVVIQGLPGDIMPGHGTLSGSQLRDLHSYVKTIISSN